MNLSKKWLLDYVNLNVSDKEFADGMTLSGSKVEGYDVEGSKLKNIVVGKVCSLEKHPDSDHLWICKIDIGESEKLQIVTGAQNLKENDIVPVALNNSVVYGGKKITKGKLRGIESYGMLCSLNELGLSIHDFPYAIEDGIFVLGDDCDKTLGAQIQEAIGLNDVITEFEITSNRADCLSIIGLAREAAATFKVPMTIKEPIVKMGYGDVNELLQVTIDEATKCYRYCGAVVKNVRVKPSPRWMRERLRACGVRPINNIVDITNYVMLEYGQPMHAFDLRYLDGGKVIVRNAVEGEKITSLDGVERKLSTQMLVIADENKPVAIAGIMGGEYSGIMDDTSTIVFESACFNGASVRKTAKALGMRTESSSRYEKELTPLTCMNSLTRALELVQMLDAGDIIEGIVDCDKSIKTPKTLKLDWEWINNFIGINLSFNEQKEILERTGFKVDGDTITVPYFRNDIDHMADISEEIARFYGYQNIPNRELSGVANGKITKEQQLEKLISETCIACGLSEITTYSFISPKAYDKIALPKDSAQRKSVVITNPLGEDTSVMRTNVIASMLETLERNYKNRNEKVSLFELATEYIPQGTEVLPLENLKISVGMYGNSFDFFTLKGVVEEILSVVGMKEYDIERVSDNPTFHPGRTASLKIDGKQLAILGEIHPLVQENYDIKTKVYCAVIDFNLIKEYRTEQKTYKQLPKYPSLNRDLAFVCNVDIPVLTLEKEISSAIKTLLEDISLFDIYTGSQIEKGMKSVAFSLKLRSSDHTLTDEEADNAVKKAIKALEKVGATLRT